METISPHPTSEDGLEVSRAPSSAAKPPQPVASDNAETTQLQLPVTQTQAPAPIMPRAVKGVLVECDPSIKAIILKIDEDFHHAFIVEDLDDQTLVIKEAKLAELKERLEKILEKTQMMEKDDESDPEQPG